MKTFSTVQRLKLYFNLTVTVGFLAFLLGRVDWTIMMSSIGEVRGGSAALAFLSFCLIAVLEVVRLRGALLSLALRWKQLFRLHIIGSFFGNFLPGQLGADLYKIVVLRSAAQGTSRPLTLILLVRLLGLAVLLAAFLAGLAWADSSRLLGTLEWEGPSITSGMMAFWISLAALCAAAAFMLKPRLSPLLVKALDQLREALDTLSSLTIPQIAGLLGASGAILCARILVLHFMVAAVGFTLGAADALLVVTLATLATLMPISFAGIGVREGSVTFLLVNSALPYESALLVALLGRLFLILLSAAGGLWLLIGMVGARRVEQAAIPSNELS